jgi:uncharacterized protein (DUF1501 family)
LIPVVSKQKIMKRRTFIKLSATASVAGLTPFELRAALHPLVPLLECPDVSNRKLVLINLAGGNDGLNTVIPLNQYGIYSSLRPTIKVPNSGLKKYITLDGSLPNEQQIGLNPALTGFKSMYDQGWLRVLQSVGYPSQNKSHFKSTDLYFTGNDGNGLQNGYDSGWIGRFMELYYNDLIAETFPLAVEIGSNKTSLGFHGEHEHGMSLNITGQDPAGFYSVLSGLGGVPPENIPDSHFGVELDYIINTDALSNQYAQSISAAFNRGNNAVTYPNSDIANQLKTVARLMSGDLKTKVFMVRISGFDTHNSQVQDAGDPNGTHYTLLTRLSEAVSAFFQDINQQNFAEDVVGLTFSEFGRKAKENGNLGSDHGEIAPMFVFGLPVAGGVSGINPDLTEATDQNNFQIKTVQYDYRQTFGTLLQDFLGANDTIIDAAFFNHTLNESFSNTKVEELVKDSFTVSEACINGTEEEVPPPLEDMTWQVYPNPFVSQINISSLDDLTEVTCHVYSITGALVHHEIKYPSSGRFNLSLSHLTPGAYLLSMESGDLKESHKIIKQ